MTSTLREPSRSRPKRKLRGLFDRWKTRPIAIFVFLLSVLVVISLNGLSTSRVLAPAVAQALGVEHPAPTATYVESVHVLVGDEVDEGAPLATLSSDLLERELGQIEAELQSLRFRMEWELARVRIESTRESNDIAAESARARRDGGLSAARERRGDTLTSLAEQQAREVQELVDRNLSSAEELSSARLEVARAEAQAALEGRAVRVEREYRQELDGLTAQTLIYESVEASALGYFEAELQVLLQRRRAIIEDLDHLIVQAHSSGRIERILPVGSAVSIGTSVASIVPAEPVELIAYLPPDTLVHSLPLGSEVAVSASGWSCPQTGRVLRLGATVEQAPMQLVGILQNPVFGFPVYISVPENCQLSVGQAVSVEFTARLQ